MSTTLFSVTYYILLLLCLILHCRLKTSVFNLALPSQSQNFSCVQSCIVVSKLLLCSVLHCRLKTSAFSLALQSQNFSCETVTNLRPCPLWVTDI